MTLQVGMRVRVRENANNLCTHGFNENMMALCGQIVTIANPADDGDEDCVFIYEDGGEWVWNPECFEEIEELEVPDEIKTLMTKESDFELTDDQMAELLDEATELLEEYGYEPTEDALRDIFMTWATEKGWLIDLFRKSENYKGKGQIVVPATLKRPIDREAIQGFYNWVDEQYKQIIVRDYEYRIGLFTYKEYNKARNEVSRIYNSMRSRSVYNGMTENEWGREYERMSEVINNAIDKYGRPYEIYTDKGNYYVSEEAVDKKKCFCEIMHEACDLDTRYEDINILNEERCEKINANCEKLGVKARARKGQRVNKFVNKICTELGLDKIVDLRKETWTDANGNYHERLVDKGWNKKKAEFGDAINPLEYERNVIISVNPIDYWTMSFGYKWASCHTIDKENRRNNGSDNYSGCYSGGTESYMLDPSSIIVYVLPTEDEIKRIGEETYPMELKSKLKRCVFYLGEDKLVQSRVYPDGRDGGDDGLATQLRAIMQKTVSELYNTPNLWTLKKGTDECRRVIYTAYSVHYPDYTHYDDCNVSYLRRIDGYKNTNRITVGSRIICPNCGDIHTESDHITCDYCYDSDKYTCDECGNRVRQSEAIIIDDDRIFCCLTCAERYGYVNTEDDGWHDRDDCHQDSYDGYWYYDDSEGIWIGDDWYYNSNHAEWDGWRWSEIDDDYVSESDAEYTYDGELFDPCRHPDAIELDDEWYLSEEDAIESGNYERNEETDELERVA